MKNQPQMILIRNRKLGVLIYDGRIAKRRKIEECAEAIGATAEEYASFEAGSVAPSLPQIELLSVFLDIPMDHFWGKQSISTALAAEKPEDKAPILGLRNRVIGASLRLARSNKNMSIPDLAQKTGLNEEALQQYEAGDAPVPLPELEVLSTALDHPLPGFFDHHGPIGKWRNQQDAAQKFFKLSPELQQFISKPVNQPYLEIAMKLSELPVDRLRILAESSLEITL